MNPQVRPGCGALSLILMHLLYRLADRLKFYLRSVNTESTNLTLSTEFTTGEKLSCLYDGASRNARLRAFPLAALRP